MNYTKKRSFIMTAITIIMALFTISFKSVYADDNGPNYYADDDGPNYSIDKLNINCQVEKNGAVQLTRTVTYHFDDDADGLTYQQELPKSNSHYQVQKVEIADNNGKLKQLQQNDSEQNNTYTVNQGNAKDTFKIKTYHSVGSGNDVTIRYVFTMNDAVTNYKDAARLNYKIIGNNTDVNQKNVHIKFNFGQKNLDLFKTWVHCDTPVTKKASAKNGTLTIAIKKLSKNTYVETDILFPKSVTAQNSNINNSNIINTTVAREKKIQQERGILFFANYCLVPLIIIGYAALRFLIVRRKAHKANILKVGEIPHNFDIPTMPVGMANALLKERGALFDGKGIDKYNAFIGELLQLHNEGKIKIESLGDDYQIKLKDSSIINGKYSKEEGIYSLLFYIIGDDHQFTLNQLKNTVNENKHRAKNVVTALDNWFNDYLDTVKRRYTIPVADKISNNNQKYITLTLLILFGWVNYKNWDPTIVVLDLMCLVIFLLFLLAYRHNTSFNAEGLKKYIRIAGFQKMLHDTSNFKNSQLGDLTLWKDILPYAARFGLAPKVLKRLHQDFSDAEFALSFGPNNSFYYDDQDDEDFYSQAHSTFSKAHGRAGNDNSSDSGFGDSGGFGGNSGDGAF